MAYKRKIVNVWHVQQYTGPQYGWETVCAEERLTEARQRLREYRENQSEYAVRIKLGREPKVPSL